MTSTTSHVLSKHLRASTELMFSSLSPLKASAVYSPPPPLGEGPSFSTITNSSFPLCGPKYLLIITLNLNLSLDKQALVGFLASPECDIKQVLRK